MHLNDTSRLQRIIDRKELKTLIPYSTSQIARMEKQGLFPKRVRLGPNRIGWFLADVLRWMDERKALTANLCVGAIAA